MSKSIRISDELAEFAEAAAVESHRSPPQQIEHWAQIGRVLEPALSYRAESAVKRVGRADLDAALNEVGTPETVQRTQEMIRNTSGEIVSTDS
ncbi:MAG: hypothetical protein P1U85_03265 [Verrucomicrobiales bacterium]|nr:hypothetical protein [Verrucomicrobiales bacterium]